MKLEALGRLRFTAGNNESGQKTKNKNAQAASDLFHDYTSLNLLYRSRVCL